LPKTRDQFRLTAGTEVPLWAGNNRESGRSMQTIDELGKAAVLLSKE
jgi:hypothetical protein